MMMMIGSHRAHLDMEKMTREYNPHIIEKWRDIKGEESPSEEPLYFLCIYNSDFLLSF